MTIQELNTTEAQVAEDRGFYSDMFKDEHGVRPRTWSDAQLAEWVNNNFLEHVVNDTHMIVRREVCSKF